MIGDSWDTDIAGALNFGMDQIMFLNNGLHPVPEVVKAIIPATDSPVLELGHQTKTWFIQNISELQIIL